MAVSRSKGRAPFSELQALSAAVTDLRESPSGFCITSAGEDGSILVYTILKGHSLMLSGIDTSDMFDESSLYNSGV